MKKSHITKAMALAFAASIAVGTAPAVYAADGTAEPKVVYSFDFEDGDVSAFTNRGGDDTTELSASTDASVSGDSALLASGRTESWNGPAFRLDDKLEPFTEYYISAKIKGRYYTGAMMSFQYTVKGETEPKYQNLVQNLNGSDWMSVERIKVSFTDEMEGVYVYFEGGSDDLFIDDFVVEEVPAVEIEQDIPGLAQVFGHDFKVGTSLVPNNFSSRATMDIVEKHYYQSLTCGNEMKPDAVLNKAACQAYVEETGDDTVPQISFSAAKPLLNYCKKNNVPVRIHTLVWHSQTPDWFFKENYADDGKWVSKEKMLLRMENYIKAFFEELVALYPTIDFYACDVVNEAWLDDGKPRSPGEQGSGGSQNSAWVQVFGDNSFIEPAFTYARKYAPEGCKLYYNDFNEYMDGKMNAIIEMAKDFKEKGIIDGIGMQSHLDARQSLDAAFPSVNMYKNALKKYSELGLDIQITELDVTTPENPKSGDFDVQAAYYKGIWDAIYEYKDYVSAVILWGVTDDQSWRGKQYPLLFDADYKAKKAFHSIIEGYEVPAEPPTNPPVTPTEPQPSEPTDDPVDNPDVEVTLLGDANCDGKVTIADSTAILQSIGNPDKYGLSDEGTANADVDGTKGITANDALGIQKYDAKLISDFSELSK
ncbi:MAG: endo-1,4-beta-xylanase [Ruminococcus sp.]|nr:endo-1,4-beta-xylanase [Ruminococcus sp.]MBR6580029.1 endo-1,4-beta-xylanase [Ruminococcus sp.]